MGANQGNKAQWMGTTPQGADVRMGAGVTGASGSNDPWGNGADPWAQFSAGADGIDASRKRGRVGHAGLEPQPAQDGGCNVATRIAGRHHCNDRTFLTTTEAGLQGCKVIA